jgi:hypothetical protein
LIGGSLGRHLLVHTTASTPLGSCTELGPHCWVHLSGSISTALGPRHFAPALTHLQWVHTLGCRPLGPHHWFQTIRSTPRGPHHSFHTVGPPPLGTHQQFHTTESTSVGPQHCVRTPTCMHMHPSIFNTCGHMSSCMMCAHQVCPSNVPFTYHCHLCLSHVSGTCDCHMWPSHVTVTCDRNM